MPTFALKVRAQSGAAPPYVDLAGGLPAMACGVAHPAALQYTFWLTNGDGHWGLNFNPNAYPLGTAAIIVRTGTQTWVASAGASERAELVSFSHSGIRRRNGPSREGVFVVPFKLTIVATEPVAPGAGC